MGTTTTLHTPDDLRTFVAEVFASLAEFERDLIRERTNAGLEAARARDRPPLLSGDKLRTARQLYEQKDMTVAQIGEVLGVSRITVYRALRRESGALPTRKQTSTKTA
ncbi:helix-turn-helix domain-containing protein [Corynebacterium sp. A21]|uniref:helix-turn-helix domain-containing protein n=1 Tax=Corynebacterium sp. A21 TaxID=3457318 RepID=UPI003FCEEC30